MKAEYPNKRSYPQKDSAEHEEYAGAQSVGCRTSYITSVVWEEADSDCMICFHTSWNFQTISQ